jgi:septal ring factor EnvC (AmiA/AmiB activator)
MNLRRRTDREPLPARRPRGRRWPRLVALSAMLVALGVGAMVPLASAAHQSLGQLNSSLGSVQAREQSLADGVASLDRLISSLDSEISLVQSREAAVHAALTGDEARLVAAQRSLVLERSRLALLERRLTRARLILGRQLVSNYEAGRPDLMTVVLESSGFSQLLNRIEYLHDAEHQQQTLISATRKAKAAADAAAQRLARLESSDRAITAATEVRERALAGMNALLSSKQSALQHAKAGQQAALGAARARGHQLQAAISKVQAEQAAALAAEQGPAPTALGPSGGWVIPYAIVLCESGGQNLPPNSAGASGYYQIIPSTWSLFGGTGPAAYLASKSEQDAVASRIWNGGAGASNWVCAGIVGIH